MKKKWNKQFGKLFKKHFGFFLCQWSHLSLCFKTHTHTPTRAERKAKQGEKRGTVSHSLNLQSFFFPSSFFVFKMTSFCVTIDVIV